MKNLLKKSTSLWAVALILSAAPFALQASELPSSGPIPFSAYDQNGDGGVSEEEYNNVRALRMQQRADSGRPMRNAANTPEFSDFDADGNAVVSEEELIAGQNARMQQRGSGKGMGMGRGQN
jgi:hypothetical protein